MSRIALLCLVAAVLVCPSAATAGVLTSEPLPFGGGGSGSRGSSVTYRANGDPSSRITARTLRGLGLLLTDSRSRIVLAGADARRECSRHGEHTAICKFVTSLHVAGGNRGDIIDARAFNCSAPGVACYATLEGGSGDDTIYAPTESGAVLSGGLGDNVLVGGTTDQDEVSYEHALGPVAVDLAAGIGEAPGERDRLVRTPSVQGSERYANRLMSGMGGDASLYGGDAGNYFLARAPTFISIAYGKQRRPSTVVCERGVSTVEHVEARDLLLGTCAVGQLALLGPMRLATSPVLRVREQAAPDASVVRVARVRVTAAASGMVVGEVREPESGAAPAIDCELNAGGQALLRRLHRLRVRVAEYDAPGSGILDPLPGRATFFDTTLTLQRSGTSRPRNS